MEEEGRKMKENGRVLGKDINERMRVKGTVNKGGGRRKQRRRMKGVQGRRGGRG